jgi:outer membrane protein assembly factor BamE (lipoprotein component of BamABCDE complex)
MRMVRALWLGLAASAIFATVGCQSAQEHAADVRAGQEAGGQLTVGTVQKEIRVGMSGAEVATALGSPNVVTTDENRREVWIYDKISTDRIYSTIAGGVSALIFGGYRADAGAQSTRQRTLTVIVKYDENKKVRDFAYHSSNF